MNRKEILETAIKCVCEERQNQYGSPERSFEKIAHLWNAYLGDEVVDSHDVAIMMMLLKIARISSGVQHLDNYIDIAGYAACAVECADVKKS